MSESMAGVTFLALGNGSPDVFSTYAAMSTHSGSLAIGELIGAAGFITAVVAGSMALVRPFRVARKSFVRDVGFFIVATAFSLAFIYDGKLSLLECTVMVAFYVFYVFFVVLWHWWRGRKRQKREKEATARGHYEVPNVDTDVQEPYHDDPEDSPQRTPRISRQPSTDDFSSLERGGSIRTLEIDDEEELETGRLMGELSSNMRLRRPMAGTRSRSSTLNPIRPSLVGALEFRSVLDSLQKSRNIQTLPINLRRYSDDPNSALNRQSDQLSTASGPVSAEHHQSDPQTGKPVVMPHSTLVERTDPLGRVRAVSAAANVESNQLCNAAGLGSLSKLNAVPEIDSLSKSTERVSGLQPPTASATVPSRSSPSPVDNTRSPRLSLSPSVSEDASSRDPSSKAQSTMQYCLNDFAPRDSEDLDQLNCNKPTVEHLLVNDLHHEPPKPLQPRSLPKLDVPGGDMRSRSISGASSPTSPFPTFTDAPRSQSPIGIPVLEYPASASEDTHYPHDPFIDAVQEKPLRWWPYSILPPPGVLLSTLFPTLYCWPKKNLWEKFLGLVAAPSVFLLTITLPVVEPTRDDEEEDGLVMANNDGAVSLERRENQTSAFNAFTPESACIQGLGQTANSSVHPKSFVGHGDTPTLAVEVEARHQRQQQGVSPNLSRQSTDPKSLSCHPFETQIQRRPGEAILPSDVPATTAPTSASRDWNRWLIVLQFFTAPFFIVFILWVNGVFTSATSANPEGFPSARDLLKPALISLLVSLVSLILLLLTTTPGNPPKWRPLLCFVGFAVSIAWISTVAGEVVGVLKTLGVILNISDAILGLTIFAVGNSLGDLVADITVARLGYPVMALSACFGGPMLNILLGIGISGLAMMVRTADQKHHRHPQKQLKYKPYEIDVGRTLLVSGAVLLVTLIGLLIVVPINKWRMDRKVGCGLISLWVLGTVGNLVMEVTGIAGGKEA